MQKIRVGVLGLGQGRSHLRAFQMLEGSSVVAVCDQDAALAERVAREHNVEKRHPNYESMLDDHSIDLIVVATPDHLHGQHAIQALEAGKHVLSEIPMATTLDECRRIIELTDRSGLKYHMGNQVRYAFCLRDVQRLIQAGDLGDVFYGEGEYLHEMEDIVGHRQADHWRIHPQTPQTTLLGGGPHAIDTLRWLMGVRFVEVQAYHATQQSRWQTTHTTIALFKAGNGGVAKVTVSYGMKRPYCLYYSVYGSDGSFERTRPGRLCRGHHQLSLSQQGVRRATYAAGHRAQLEQPSHPASARAEAMALWKSNRHNTSCAPSSTTKNRLLVLVKRPDPSPPASARWHPQARAAGRLRSQRLTSSPSSTSITPHPPRRSLCSCSTLQPRRAAATATTWARFCAWKALSILPNVT